MAQSGTTFTLQSSSYQGRYMKLTCTSSQDIANNKTNISWKLESLGGSSSYYATICRVNINETEVYYIDKGYSYKQFPVAKGSTTGSLSVAMNNDGSHSAITVYMDVAIYTSSTTRYSDTWQLNTIPRYPTINSFTVSKVSGSSTQLKFNWTADSTIDYLWYSTNNGSSWTGYNTADGTSGNFTVSGLASNTWYSCKIRLRRKDSQLTKDSSKVDQSTYQQPSANISTANISGYNGITQVKVSWSSNMTISTVKYSKDNGASWSVTQTPNATSGNYTFTGLTEGSTPNFKVQVTAATGGCVTTSGTSQKTLFTRVKGNLYVNGTKVATNNGQTGVALKNGDTLQIKDISNTGNLNYKLFFENPDNQHQYTSSATSGTNILSMTADQIFSRLQYFPNDPSQGFNVGIVTLNDSSQHALYHEFFGTISAANVNPTFDENRWTYQDTNANTVALTGSNQILVNGFSKLRVSVNTAASGNGYATIKQYVVSGCTSGSSTTTGNIDCANATSGGTIKVTAKDSRNNSTETTKTATFKNYAIPTLSSISATRGNGGVGTQTTLAFNGKWWNANFGASANTLSASYRYKSGSTWSEARTITLTTSGNNYSFSDTIYGDLSADGFTLGTTFTIELTITDALNGGKTWTTTLNSGTPAIAISGNNVAIGGQYDTDLGGKLQVQGNEIVNGSATINGNATITGNTTNNGSFTAGKADGTTSFQIHGQNGSNIYWKENGYGDKFAIVPDFGGENDSNKLHIKGAVGGAGTDPSLYDLITIAGQTGLTWFKGDINYFGRTFKRVTLTGGDGNNTGWRQVFSFTAGTWNNYRMALLVQSRHQGVGIVSIGISTGSNNKTLSGTPDIRYYGANTQLTANCWRLYFNSSTGLISLYWYYSDYSSCDVIQICNSGFPDISNGTWSTSIPSSAGTEYACKSNYADSAESASWSSYPYGFSSRATSQGWGSQTGTFLTGWQDSTGGSIAFRRDNPTGGQTSMIIDGTVYVNEGKSRCYGATTLYNNTSGTNGTITLAETAANFTFIEIFYRIGSGSGTSSVKVDTSKNMDNISLTVGRRISGTTVQINTTTVKISAKSLTHVTNGGVNVQATPEIYTGNEIYITRVIGYR